VELHAILQKRARARDGRVRIINHTDCTGCYRGVNYFWYSNIHRVQQDSIFSCLAITLTHLTTNLPASAGFFINYYGRKKGFAEYNANTPSSRFVGFDKRSVSFGVVVEHFISHYKHTVLQVFGKTS